MGGWAGGFVPPTRCAPLRVPSDSGGSLSTPPPTASSPPPPRDCARQASSFGRARGGLLSVRGESVVRGGGGGVRAGWVGWVRGAGARAPASRPRAAQPYNWQRDGGETSRTWARRRAKSFVRSIAAAGPHPGGRCGRGGCASSSFPSLFAVSSSYRSPSLPPSRPPPPIFILLVVLVVPPTRHLPA